MLSVAVMSLERYCNVLLCMALLTVCSPGETARRPIEPQASIVVGRTTDTANLDKFGLLPGTLCRVAVALPCLLLIGVCSGNE